MWAEGFLNALSLTNLLWLMFGSALGLVIGVLPALGANFGVALMLPFTFGMDPAAAIIFLCAIHASCNYGDSVTSILLNTPGGPGTLASCWDGYPLAQKGRGGEALGIATFSSFFGGAVVWIFLALMVGPITRVAMAFGAPEYFALVVMALGLVSVASKGETLKGLIMVCFGLALSTIGQDRVMGTTYRFAYGIPWLEAGIPMVVSTLGIFALSQVIVLLGQGGIIAKSTNVNDSLLKGFKASIKRPFALIRGGLVGAFVGVLPGVGVSLAGIAAYLTEKKYSKESSEFGKGAPSGLVAAEVGKGACVMGDLIPTFTLGVPGSVTGAILMAALVLQGIEPGPKFLMSGVLPFTVFAGLLLAQASFLVNGLVLGRWVCRVANIPIVYLAPTLAILVFVGAFAERNYVFDIFVALVFGVFAYALERINYPVVCLVLGLILGDLLEANFDRSLAISFGSYGIFFTRPIALGMLIFTALSLLIPYAVYLIRRNRRKPVDTEMKNPDAESVKGSWKAELSLLSGVALIQAIFIFTAREYDPLVRLFPNIVNFFGIGLILWRLLPVLLRVLKNRERSGSSPVRAFTFSFFGGQLSWPAAVLSMLGFVFCVYIIGFVIAAVLYVTGVIIMMSGITRWKSALVTGLIVGFSILIFAKLVHFQLPIGWLIGV